ncbi:MAG: endonuclease [Sutterella wadsworthensis]
MSAEYRLMQADMYNLFPAVGAVNAIRSNYNYELLPGVPNTFGTCEMKIDGRRAEPPERSRGEIARAMLYMEGAYAPVFRMSDRQRRLAQNWNEQHPVVQWECTRAARIEKLQGNVNPVVKDACLKAGLTYRP